jgi:protein SCO1/2
VKQSTLSRLLLLALVCSGAAQAAEEPAAAMPEAVAAIGRINGAALACGYPDVSVRARGIVLARVAKTRALGETFENATNTAFQAQTSDKAACAPRAVLAVELEAAALKLAAPATHKLTDTSEAPEHGINPRYLLQAGNGRAIMDSDFPKHFQLITFGYTSCPDICPTTLAEMADVLKRLGDKADELKPIFVSLDPERDSLAVLRTYTAFFDSRITGATASPELVKRAAENFKVRYEKVVEPGAAPDRYALDHTAGMYLLAPGGQFLARFPYGTPTADIAERIGAEMRRKPESGAPEGAK